MDKKGWSIAWTGIAAAVTLLAANGDKLLEFAEGLRLFLLKLSGDAVMGVWSFLLAVLLGMLSRAPLVKYLPQCPKHPTRRELAIDLSAVAIGLAVMFAQLPNFFGVAVGVLAGLLAPQLAKVIAVLWGIRRES